MYISTLSLNSAPDGGGWLTSRAGRFAPGNYLVPIVYEAGWASGPVWTGAKITRIRSPDRPTHSKLHD